MVLKIYGIGLHYIMKTKWERVSIWKKTADELNEQERIMACVDIYQALTEERPYKKGMSHEKHVIYLMKWQKKVLWMQIFHVK